VRAGATAGDGAEGKSQNNWTKNFKKLKNQLKISTFV